MLYRRVSKESGAETTKTGQNKAQTQRIRCLYGFVFAAPKRHHNQPNEPAEVLNPMTVNLLKFPLLWEAGKTGGGLLLEGKKGRKKKDWARRMKACFPRRNAAKLGRTGL